MQNRKSDPPVTRSEFLRETGLIRSEFLRETGLIRSEFIKESESVHKGFGSIREIIGKLAVEVVKTQSDLKEVKEHIETQLSTKEDISNVLNAIDAVMVKGENYDRKAVVHDHRINDHEERITHLEKTVAK